MKITKYDKNNNNFSNYSFKFNGRIALTMSIIPDILDKIQKSKKSIFTITTFAFEQQKYILRTLNKCSKLLITVI